MGGCIKDISNCNSSCYSDATVYDTMVNEYKYKDVSGNIKCDV